VTGAALIAASTTASSAACVRCFHCDQRLTDGGAHYRIDGVDRAFCCDGCAAAARWIHDANLDDYYRLRSDPAGKALAAGTDLAVWDRQDVMAAHVRNVPEGCEIVLLTDGMRCAACAWLIDRALAREQGVIEVCANAITGRIRIIWNPAHNRLSKILARLLTLGYRPFLAGNMDAERARRSEQRRWLLRLGIAGLATLQAMMFAEALYLDTNHQMPLPTRDFFRWLTFLVATPVVFYAGFPFLAGAWRELKEHRAGMDVLVASSTLLAWGASTVETLRGGPFVWFDAAVMFVFLLLAARMLEQRTRQIASARIDALARARPILAERETAAGQTECVAVTQLSVGDTIRVAAGENIPADATLLDATAAFNESLLTGEARPVARHPGDAVLAGSICTDQPLRLQVAATGSATRLFALSRLVQKAQEHRPRVARVADRVASRFVLALAITTLLVYLYWHAKDPTRAFEIALALLVISCPCALSLSVPAALTAAHSRLSQLGILAVRPDALETLARIDDIVFDKTGTLGDGQWQIAATSLFNDCSEAHALALAAALERDLRHPIATAFRPYVQQACASGVVVHAGRGVAGSIDGKTLYLGAADFAAGRPDDGAIWLGDGHQPLARFELREQPRPDAVPALTRLREQGLRLHVLSGDAVAAVERFTTSLQPTLESSAGRLLPEDKLARVRAMQAQGRCVAMVGDGINDAPVLAGADVSIAVADGAALAQQTADLAMLHPSLLRIPAAIDLARRTRRIIRQNISWAIGYNLLALPLAATGFVAPWEAALAMVVSSLTVTLNALRLTRAAPP
jgi:Cu2+-exporting ATPase